MNNAKKFALTLMCGLALVVALPVASHADGDPANPYNGCYENSSGLCVEQYTGSCVNTNFPNRRCDDTQFGVCRCVQ